MFAPNPDEYNVHRSEEYDRIAERLFRYLHNDSARSGVPNESLMQEFNIPSLQEDEYISVTLTKAIRLSIKNGFGYGDGLLSVDEWVDQVQKPGPEKVCRGDFAVDGFNEWCYAVGANPESFSFQDSWYECADEKLARDAWNCYYANITDILRMVRLWGLDPTKPYYSIISVLAMGGIVCGFEEEGDVVRPIVHLFD